MSMVVEEAREALRVLDACGLCMTDELQAVAALVFGWTSDSWHLLVTKHTPDNASALDTTTHHCIREECVQSSSRHNVLVGQHKSQSRACHRLNAQMEIRSGDASTKHVQRVTHRLHDGPCHGKRAARTTTPND